MGCTVKAHWNCSRFVMECLGEKLTAKKGKEPGNLERNKCAKQRNKGIKMVTCDSWMVSKLVWSGPEPNNCSVSYLLIKFNFYLFLGMRNCSV